MHDVQPLTGVYIQCTFVTHHVVYFVDFRMFPSEKKRDYYFVLNITSVKSSRK